MTIGAGGTITNSAGAGTLLADGLNPLSVSSAGSLNLSSSGTGLAIERVINDSNAATAVAVSTGTVTLSATNTYSGGTSVSGGGRLRIGAADNIGGTALTLDSGTLSTTSDLTLGQTITLGAGPGSLEAAAATTLTVNSAIGQSVAGGALTKTGSGTLNLNGANTYSGATAITAGTLVAGNALALGTAAGGTTVATGASLAINNVDLGTEALSLAGTGAGAAGALVGTGANAGRAVR